MESESFVTNEYSSVDYSLIKNQTPKSYKTSEHQSGLSFSYPRKHVNFEPLTENTQRSDRYKNTVPVVFRVILQDTHSMNYSRRASESNFIKLRDTDYDSSVIMFSVIKSF